MKKKLGRIGVIAALALLGATLTAEANVETNRLAGNKLATNRIIRNDLATNRVARNDLASNKIASSGEATGEGSVMGITVIELADGTTLRQ